MTKYLVYNIETLENLKFAKTNMQKDAEKTMEYIPGSAIRGAYIYKYIVSNNIKDINKGEHRQKLLNGGIKFLNAYPLHKDNRSIPFPKGYFAEKDKIKLKSANLQMITGLDKSLNPSYDKVRGPVFVVYEDENIFVVNVGKTSNLHINKMKGKEENKLFRYESIIKNQIFQGIIKIEDESLIEEVKEIFEDKVVYLGGSKGSGYGKCKIGKIVLEKGNPEVKTIKDLDDIKNEIYILAMSDIIYSNKLGEYMTYIDEEEIKERLNLEEVLFIDSSIDTKNITNFNNKWDASTPNINSIKAGSVFKYKIRGDLDKKLLESFIDQGLGERKADGFGRFNILSSMREGLLIRERLIDIRGKHENTGKNLSGGDQEFLQKLIDDIYKNRMENDISRRIIDIDSKLTNTNNLNPSQWGKLLELFSSLYKDNYIDGKEKVEKYFTHIKSRGSVAYKQLSMVRYNSSDSNINLLEYMERFVSDSTDTQKLQNNSDVKTVEIKGFKSKIDKEFAYKHNIKILRELSRYQIRKGEQ